MELGGGRSVGPSHVRREFRRALRNVDGLDPAELTPSELRHSFLSPLSDQVAPLEDVSRLVGHSSTAATELVYRKQIRPVVQLGAVTMNRLVGARTENDSHADSHSGPEREGPH